METTDILARETNALVFDLYGTVVDMQGGLTRVVTPLSSINSLPGCLWSRNRKTRLDEIHPCISLFERAYARQNTFLRIFPHSSRNQQLGAC